MQQAGMQRPGDLVIGQLDGSLSDLESTSGAAPASAPVMREAGWIDKSMPARGVTKGGISSQHAQLLRSMTAPHRACTFLDLMPQDNIYLWPEAHVNSLKCSSKLSIDQMQRHKQPT